MDYLADLNEQQREAVRSTEGSLLILAGAGSGKTRVIAHRIAYLIAEKGVAPWNILAVTFTNKAAQEMRQRVQRLLRDQELSSAPLVSTFHSLCVRILRQDIEKLNDKYTRTFTIYDQDDSVRLIKNSIKDLGYDEKHLGLRATQSAISSAKNRGEDVEAFAARADYVDERRAAMARVYATYEERLHTNNALDFDDLMIKTVRLLRQVPEVREKYNNKFRYILVDEYQDTNSLQFALISLLTEKQQNIAVVGDEDQSIYKWRGADITNILNFEKHFPNTQTIRLEQNYRSTQTILDVAGAVVKHNIERKGKNLWTSNPRGDRVRYFQAFDAESEARFVASKILEHRQEEYDLRAAVLYRTNSQSRVFEESMRRAGLPYNIVGGFSFYERMEVRDIISYLKLALNPNDSIALQRVINSPPRGIGKQTLDELTRRAAIGVQSPTSNVQSPPAAGSADILSAGASVSERGSSPTVREGVGDRDNSDHLVIGRDSLSLWDTIALVIDDPQNLSSRAVSALRSFRKIILRLSEMAGTSSVNGQSSSIALPSDIVKAAIFDTGYENSLKSEKTDEAEARLENLQELVNAAVDYDEQGIEGLREFIDHSALVSDTDQYKGDAPVTLMTAHSAKGLEFPLVFIVGLEDGLFPHSRSATDPAELEEERRLCYVAMTRAERFLYVTHAMKRRVYGEELASEPSQFLNEMPLDLMEDLSRGNSWLSFARGSSSIDYEHGEYRRGSAPVRTASGSDRAMATGSERGSSPTMRESAVSYRSTDRGSARKDNTNYAGKTYNSVDSIAEFFKQRTAQLGNTSGTFQSSREKAEQEKSNRRHSQRPTSTVQRPGSQASGSEPRTPNSEHETRNSKPETAPSDFIPGSYVKHAKYGRGLVLRREGVGDSLKLTVTFPGYGQKKLIQKYAGLEKA
ncbi:MAG TPA: UvrD-helicase domain-containing protein [Pyrinomonadaceae bacterium]|jgi:DNA helicase-2/ATP-dependent DNA helicase PcrA|nr:UvrD-helicase domain-containing protein [Pyrinomonadaceae bacterium]